MYYSPIFYKVELAGDALTDLPNIMYDENQPAWSEDNNDYFYYPLYIQVPYDSAKPTIIYKQPGYSLTYTWEQKWLVDNMLPPNIPSLNSVSVTCDGIDITDKCYSVIENQRDPNQELVPVNKIRYHHAHTVEIPKYLIGDIIITYTNTN